MVGNWEEFTYVGAKDSTVIYYIVVNKKTHENVTEFRIGSKDNMPLLWKWKESRGQEEEEEIEVIVWNNEAIHKIQE